DRQNIYNISRDFIGGKSGRQGLHQRLAIKFDNSFEYEILTGLVFSRDWKDFGLYEFPNSTGPSFQILNLRLAFRVGPDGNTINQIVFGLVQRLGVVYKDGKFDRCYSPGSPKDRPEGGFEVYGGCTLIFDLDSLKLKYAISKPLLK